MKLATMKLIFMVAFVSLVLAFDELYEEAISKLAKSPLKGIEALENAGYNYNHQEALLTLGNYFLFNSSSLRNSTIAFKHFSQLASLGNAVGQRQLGLMYATGIGISRDYAMAYLYIGLAAIGGDVLASQVMGYWKVSGIATLKSCDKAISHLSIVANIVTNEFYNGHPLGKNTPSDKINIPELEFNGVYGYGVSGPGNPKAQKDSESALSSRDIIEYYSLQADGGDKSAQILVAQVFYMGSLKIEVDYAKARKYALMAFKQNPVDENKKYSKKEADKFSVSGNAADLLGKMYWRGEGVERNDVTARRWFQKGAAVFNAACMYSLGLMYEEGLADLKKDEKKALYYFNEAASLDNPSALVKLALRNGLDSSNTFSKLQKSSGKGNLKATYYLAQHYLKGVGVTKNCVTGVGLLRHIIQKADWHQYFTPLAEELYNNGDIAGSLIAYIFAAELGYEAAQTNAAWILDRRLIPSVDYPKIFSANISEKDRYQLAYTFWNRAANLGNVDARVKMGDYYFQRYLGQDLRNSTKQYELAAKYYKLAADHEFSAIAMWNLANMYETGLGVPRDYYLAKRMYDLCLITNPAGYIPVNLALLKLYIKWGWSWIKGEKVQSLFAKPPSLNGAKTTVEILQDDDLYTMENEEQILSNQNLLLVVLIGVATLIYYWRQRIGGQDSFNRHPLPTDEETEPIMADENEPKREFEE